MNETSNAFRIRPMEGRDIPSVVSVDRLVFKDPWPESAYVQEVYFNPQSHYFVLESLDSGRTRLWTDRRQRQALRILGFVGMRVEGVRGHISTLALRAEWRGQRLGEVLLLIAISQAIKDGAEVVGLEVRVSNYVAQRLYNKYDFKSSSRLHRYYADGEDAFFMQVRVNETLEYAIRVQARLAELLQEIHIETTAEG